MRPASALFGLIAGSKKIFLAGLVSLSFIFLAPAPTHAFTIPCLGTEPDIPGCPITVPSLPCLPIPPFTLPLIGSVSFPPGCTPATIPCIAPGVPPLCSGAPLVTIPCILPGVPPGCTGTPIMTSYPCVPGLGPPAFPPGCTAVPIPRIPCIIAGTPPGCTGAPIFNIPNIPCISQSPPTPPGCTPIPLNFFPCVGINTPPGCTPIPLPCVSPGVPVGCIAIPLPCVSPGVPVGCVMMATPCISPGIPPGCAETARPCIGFDSSGNKVPPRCFGTPPTTSCDPEILDAIEARGYIEAQREVMQDQNLILKPDSVLQYTCLDALQYNVAAGVNFSEIGWIGAFGKMGLTALDTALIETSISILYQPSTVPPKGYLLENFVQPLMGGRMLADYPLPSIPFLFYDWQPYTCDYMQRVWQTAKCMNFFDEEDHDGFYDFSWYTASDPRTYVLPLGWNQANTCNVINFATKAKVPKPNPMDTGVAFNWKPDSHMLTTENPWPSDTTPYEDDPVDATYMALIMPVGTSLPVSGGNIVCAAPIETGVCVTRGLSTVIGPYMDAVCPNPGCHYDVPAGGGGSCADVFDCVP